MEFEDADADVYYIAPRLSHWATYDRAFQDGEVLENSLLLKPSEVLRGIQAQGGTIGVHRIVYDRSYRYVCSEPVELREQRPREAAREIADRVRRHHISLEGQIGRLFERPRPETGPGALAGRLRSGTTTGGRHGRDRWSGSLEPRGPVVFRHRVHEATAII
jgi:hypothetical protein